MAHYHWLPKLVILTSLACAALCHPAHAHASRGDDTTRVQQLKQQINITRNQKSRTEQKLKQTEIEISRLANKLLSIQKQIQRQKRQLRQLNIRYQRYNQKLAKGRHQLGHALAQAYMLSRESELKAILNAESLDKIQRLTMEYRYAARAHIALINRLQTLITTLTQTRQQIERTLSELRRLRRQRLTQKQQMARHKKSRQSHIAALKRQLKSKQAQLARLKHNRKQLNRVVHKRRAKKKSPRQPFTQLKHQLPWPVEGRITHDFGSYYPYSSIKRRGMIIKAAANTKVHAIAAGEVIFANWLSGYGLIMIISHGEGFMSIYAHNETLLKQPGEYVKAREPIARVGQSGGYTQPQLYFALRHSGQPVNPHHWLKKHNN